MKARSGFVSNSSSSSFVLLFSEAPKTQPELKRRLFGGSEVFTAYGETHSTEALATIVWNDLQEATERLLSAEEIQEALISFFVVDLFWQYRRQRIAEITGASDLDILHSVEKRVEAAVWRQAEKDAPTAARAYAEEHQGEKAFLLTYNDRGRYGRVLDNGAVFENVTHLRISHH